MLLTATFQFPQVLYAHTCSSTIGGGEGKSIGGREIWFSKEEQNVWASWCCLLPRYRFSSQLYISFSFCERKAAILHLSSGKKMKEAACSGVLGVNSAPQHSWVETLTPPPILRGDIMGSFNSSSCFLVYLFIFSKGLWVPWEQGLCLAHLYFQSPA